MAQSDALPPGARGRVLDLVFRIENLGGQDLRVKENDTEIRIELAAEMLFDFDKAEPPPKARYGLGPRISFATQGQAQEYRSHRGTLTPRVTRTTTRNRPLAVNGSVTKEGLQEREFRDEDSASRSRQTPSWMARTTRDGRLEECRVEITMKK